MTETKRSTEEPKSRQQEKAYHKLFGQIADYCVEHNINLRMAMEKIAKYEPAVTPEFVKSSWRSILFTQTGKESTKDQTKEDVQNVQRDFAELWREITGETINWPSVEAQYWEQYENNN